MFNNMTDIWRWEENEDQKRQEFCIHTWEEVNGWMMCSECYKYAASPAPPGTIGAVSPRGDNTDNDSEK